MQDVAIRWNSQYDMLFRFVELKSAIQWWIDRESAAYEVLLLNEMKWNQVKFLLQFLKSIKKITIYISQTKSVLVHKIESIYNQLFNHLESQKKQTRKINRAL